MKQSTFIWCGVLMFAAAPLAAKQAPLPDFAAAVAAPGRPDDAIKLDDSRKPADVLAFEGLKSGDQVADIMAGSGYYSEIMARAVGPKGHVTAYDPEQFVKGDPKDAEVWTALKSRNANVARETYPFDKFAAPAGAYSFVMLHLDYHDIYWESEKFGVPKTDPDAFLATLFQSVKPGGTVAVIDHVALPGDTRMTVDKLHRIDPAVVKADFAKAGFVFVGSSDLLHNTSDDHTRLVFDPAVRGKTDRFVFRFQKPNQ